MPRERRPTEHVQGLVRQNRLRVIIPLQALVLVAACALVWGWLGKEHPQLAFALIGGLVAAEIVLVILFLREPLESDETVVQPLSASPESTVLADPAGGTITIDKLRREIQAKEKTLIVPLRTARSVLADLGETCRIMVATNDDLVVLSEVRSAVESERAKIEATARLLARVAEVPFDES